MPSFTKSRFAVVVPIESSMGPLVAIYQTMTKAMIVVSQKEWSSLLYDAASQSDPATMDSLQQQGLVVREGIDETAVFEAWKQRYVHDFGTIKSKVIATRKCNNRCRYCIVDAEAKDMSHETALAMDRFFIEVLREKNPKRVKDEFSGGEVMLNHQVVIESAARRLFFCLGKGIDYSFGIISNGTLIKPSIIAGMKEVGLKGIRVSVAGSEAVHDKLRPLQNNGKSYDLIMRNLESISGMIPIGLECQYDSSSSDYLTIPDMMEDIRRRGIQIENIVFTPILPRRGETPYKAGMGDPEIYLYLVKEAQRQGYPHFTDAPSNACAADFRSSFVFDTDGSLIPCMVMQGGEKSYGDVFRGIDFVAQSQMLNRTYPEKCLRDCELLPVCMGGCRLQALVKTNDFNGVDCHYETLSLVLKDYILQKAARSLPAEQEAEPVRKAA